jgi:hypothetical protein
LFNNRHCSAIGNAMVALLNNDGSGGNEKWWTFPSGAMAARLRYGTDWRNGPLPSFQLHH